MLHEPDFEVIKADRYKPSEISQIKRTKTKCKILGEYGGKESVEFIRKRNGIIKVKWFGHVLIKHEAKEKCDLGHYHPVEKTKLWVWDYVTMKKSDIKKLSNFLNDIEEFDN